MNPHDERVNEGTNPIDLDDPRLSAYAFDQMDADERAAFETELAKDPAAQAEIEAIRALGGDLEAAFANEPALALRPEQKVAIASAAAPRRADWTGRLVGWAAAAVVLFAIGALAIDWPERRGGGRGFATPSNPLEIAKSGQRDSLSGPRRATGELRTKTPEGGSTGKPDETWTRVQVPPQYEKDAYVETLEEVDALHGIRAPEPVVSDARVPEPKPDPALVITGARTGYGSGTKLPVTLPPTTTVNLPPAQPPAVGVVGIGGGSGSKRGPTKPTMGAVTYGTPTPGGGVPPGMRDPQDARFEAKLKEYERLLREVNTPPTRSIRTMIVADLKRYDDAVRAGNVLQQQIVAGRLAKQGLPKNVLLRLVPPTPQTRGGETFQPLIDNEFQAAKDSHTSTFSIDVDTASYANVRRMLMQGQVPPPDAVRIEEFINAFDYGYAKPGAEAEHPIAMQGDVAGCPWNPNHRLARIALQAHDVGEKRPTLNLVFLIDVSGSMKDHNKLPLAQRGLSMLLENLKGEDRVGIVTYATGVQVPLQSTVASESTAIQNVINGLSANGSTNGAGGIQKAYEIARAHFIEGAANRVILLTDGDFNVGISDDGQLEQLIAKESASGIDLSVLGFGMGNYKDGKLERLSNRGNGNYAYIDSVDEARKALVDDMLGTLVTVARDVKIQVFFNPRTVRQWRLIGYANRQLQARDFNDDTKDAGEIGSGHSVTALYEIVPVGAPPPRKDVDPNPFIEPVKNADPKPDPVIAKDSSALFQLRLRYKRPGQDASVLIERDIDDAGTAFDKADDDFQFAAAVAGFGLTLRKSRHAQGLSLAAVEEMAKGATGDDPARREFLTLVAKARTLTGK